MRIHKKYIGAFIILFFIEVFIAFFVRDKIIRPLAGDVLVVILLYTLVRAFLQKRIKFLPFYLFIFAAAVETAQYFHIVERLHLENNRLMRTVIGSTFDMKDILCYLAGTVILIIWEKVSRIYQK